MSAGPAKAAGFRWVTWIWACRSKITQAIRRPASSCCIQAGFQKTEILLAYGGVQFASKMGQLAGNHFLTVVEGQENLLPLGKMVLWQGAQDIEFRAAQQRVNRALNQQMGHGHQVPFLGRLSSRFSSPAASLSPRLTAFAYHSAALRGSRGS